jgi:FdhD protein
LKRYRRAFRQNETPPAGVTVWPILRVTDQTQDAVEASIVIEEPLEVRINDRLIAILMRTPGMEKELATGFCLGEGLVADLRDVALVRHCGRAVPDEVSEGDPLDESRNRVDVTLMPGAQAQVVPPDMVQLIRSGCGRTEVKTLVENLTPVDADIQIRVGTLQHLLAQITRRQEAYRAAGGVHAAAILDTDGRPVVVCEDIGRHNAMDKAMGYCLLRGISLHDKLLVSTGRASYDMVAKGVRMGIPMLGSLSSPTSLAVELAEALNCTLLGYLRGKTLNVYTHAWRVTLDGEDFSEGESWQ